MSKKCEHLFAFYMIYLIILDKCMPIKAGFLSHTHARDKRKYEPKKNHARTRKSFYKLLLFSKKSGIINPYEKKREENCKGYVDFRACVDGRGGISRAENAYNQGICR